jgi:hypothetical protein
MCTSSGEGGFAKGKVLYCYGEVSIDLFCQFEVTIDLFLYVACMYCTPHLPKERYSTAMARLVLTFSVILWLLWTFSGGLLLTSVGHMCTKSVEGGFARGKVLYCYGKVCIDLICNDEDIIDLTCYVKASSDLFSYAEVTIDHVSCMCLSSREGGFANLKVL